jgi:hypothetical protein
MSSDVVRTFVYFDRRASWSRGGRPVERCPERLRTSPDASSPVDEAFDDFR